MSKINDDFDLKAKLFFAKWTRHDWNTYYTTAKESAESALERPLTLSEKKLLVRAIRVKGLALGSSRVLGMFLSMAIQNPADFTSLLMWDGKMK